MKRQILKITLMGLFSLLLLTGLSADSPDPVISKGTSALDFGSGFGTKYNLGWLHIGVKYFFDDYVALELYFNANLIRADISYGFEVNVFPFKDLPFEKNLYLNLSFSMLHMSKERSSSWFFLVSPGLGCAVYPLAGHPLEALYAEGFYSFVLVKDDFTWLARELHLDFPVSAEYGIRHHTDLW